MTAKIAQDESPATELSTRAVGAIAPQLRRRPLRDVAFLWGARVASSLMTIAVLATAARSLPLEAFAEFALLVGLVAWLPVLDFGFGSVMQNRVAEARARGESHASAVAACLTGATGIAVVVGLCVVLALLSWGPTAGTPGILQRTGLLVFLVGCLSLTGLSMTVHKVYAAMNRLVMSAFVSTTQNLLSLAGLWLALQWRSEVPSLVVALAGYFLPYAVVPLAALLQVVHQAGWPRGWMAGWRDRRLLHDALQFWFVLLLSLMVIQFDQFIAFTYLPPVDFAHYTVATKLINFVYFPYSALLAANWSRVSAAHALQDRAEVLAIVRSSFLIGVGYLALVLPVLLMVAGQFSQLLPRGADRISLGLLLGVGLVALNKVWTESYALVYLATGHTGIIAAYIPVQAGIAIGLQFLLVPHMGAYGLMLGGALSYFATSHWILYSRTRDVFSTYPPAASRSPSPSTS